MSDSKQPTHWPWPDALDGVIAAPDSHRVLLENDRVRVLEIVIAPGVREPAHTHRRASVMSIDRPSRIRYYDETGDLAWESGDEDREPRVVWMEPEGLHAVENVDDVPYHAVRVELK